MQWRKIKTADYSMFNLAIDEEYKRLPADEFVYNHKGEQLFWFNHTNPEALQKNHMDVDSMCEILGIDRSQFEGEEWKFNQPIGEGFHWSVRGFDCEGVPCFSHYSASHCSGYTDMNQFEPLTVGMVVKWFGWFLWRLNNSNLNVNEIAGP